MGWLLFVPGVWFVYWTAIGHKNFKIDTPPAIKT
jgi:hypothetical protein